MLPSINRSNQTYSNFQCTFNANTTSSLWQHYFNDLSLGFNYHSIRFFLSEIIPSILVALFNIGIIICVFRTTSHVRKRQEYHHNNQLSMSMITGLTSRLPQINMYDASQHRLSSIRLSSFKSSTTPIASVPFSKMSWMNIVLILHSLLFFLSSSLTSLVYFSTSDMMLAYWISVVILANCSLNFYIYCLSGRQFRRELKRIAKRYVRTVHKKILRHCVRRNNHHHSNLPRVKDQVYQAVPQQHDVPKSNPRQQYQLIERIK